MPRVRKEKPKIRTLSLDEFVKGLSQKNNELLDGMLSGINNREIDIEIDDGIEFAENIIEEWCDTERPNRQQHLKMIGALFVVMLAEELLAEDLDDGGEYEEDVARSKTANDSGHASGPGFAEVTIEALKTVRAVWGVNQQK